MQLPPLEKSRTRKTCGLIPDAGPPQDGSTREARRAGRYAAAVGLLTEVEAADHALFGRLKAPLASLIDDVQFEFHI